MFKGNKSIKIKVLSKTKHKLLLFGAFSIGPVLAHGAR